MSWTDIRDPRSPEQFERGRSAVSRLLAGLRPLREKLTLKGGDPSFLTFQYQSGTSGEKVIFQTQNDATANHRTVVAFKQQGARRIFVLGRNLLFNGIGATRHHEPFDEPALAGVLDVFERLLIPTDGQHLRYEVVSGQAGEVAQLQRFPVVCWFDEDGNLVGDDGESLDEQERRATMAQIKARLEAWCKVKRFLRDRNGPRPPGGDNAEPPPAPDRPFQQVRRALRDYKNVIIEGVPGSGKTWCAGQVAAAGIDAVADRPVDCRMMTFHPGIAYEDFIEGIRPGGGDAAQLPGGDGPPWFWAVEEVAASAGFRVRDGFFLRLCRAAIEAPDTDFLVVLDEINRANVANVLGDLLTLLEADKRLCRRDGRWDEGSGASVVLPYSGRRFAVPENVHVLGTMNTTDRSIAPLDAALRRRFAFLRVEPLGPAAILRRSDQPLFRRSVEAWHGLNELLRAAVGPDALLGHSYLLQLRERLAGDAGLDPTQRVADCWRFELLPQLVDSLTSFGKVEMLGDVEDGAEDRRLEALRRFLRSLDLDLVLEGEGLARGPSIVAAAAGWRSAAEDSSTDLAAE